MVDSRVRGARRVSVIYLTGVTSDAIETSRILQTILGHPVGLMCNSGNSYHLRIDRYPWWAADLVGISNNVDPNIGLARLELLPPERCLFITSPDAYPSAVESLRRGLEYAPLIRELGFPVAVVAQDGAEELDWPWNEIDCLFIGGRSHKDRGCRPRDEWKESQAAASLAMAARRAGKWVHMGRVNSTRRLKVARLMGCQSADGTYLKWRKRHRSNDPEGAHARRGADELARKLAELANTPPLPLQRFESPSLPVHRAAAP